MKTKNAGTIVPPSKVHVIVLPGGRTVTLGEYVRSWQQLKLRSRTQLVANWSHFPTTIGEVLDAIAYGVHDRINRHLPWRNDALWRSEDYQRAMLHAQRELNDPRSAIHWLPLELRERFAHRLS